MLLCLVLLDDAGFVGMLRKPCSEGLPVSDVRCAQGESVSMTRRRVMHFREHVTNQPQHTLGKYYDDYTSTSM
jgi:hypothetical protein